MGHLTVNATEVLHIVSDLGGIAPDAMAAAVAVKLPNGHLDFTHVENFVYEEGYHVEQRLMQALNERYGNVASIPAGATVVFVARWSPCKLCTDVHIPAFIQDAAIVTRRIRVKFRFENYYAKGIYTREEKVSSKYLWDAIGNAVAAYSTLSQRYGEWGITVTSDDRDTGVTTAKVKPQVVLAQAQVARTSTVETWFTGV
jgi:hypothetical protein